MANGKEYRLKNFLGGKYDLFSRGSFQIFTFLILFSPAFTSMFQEKVLLFSIFVFLITMNNLGVEYFSIIKKGNKPKDYTGMLMKKSVFLFRGIFPGPFEHPHIENRV